MEGMITDGDFRPTPLTPILHHFVCKLCKLVVLDGRQCANINCCVLFCSACVGEQIRKGKWSCPQCRERSVPIDMHRRVKDFLEIL